MMSSVFDKLSILFDFKWNSVSGWSIWIQEKTTYTSTTDIGRHSDISTLSPGWTPRVSDDKVVLAIFSSISDSCNCMVKICSTFSCVKDTTCVHLEVSVSCIYRNTSRLNSNGCFELINASWWNNSVFADKNFTFGRFILAYSVFSCIWIIWFELLCIRLKILECPDFKTSITSTWNRITINQLLLWKFQKISSLDEMFTFNSSSGRKCPAWSTISLILYWIDCSLCSPVDRICQTFSWKISSSSSDVSWFSSKESLSLFSS